MIGFDSFRCTRPQPSCRFMHGKQKKKWTKRITQYVNVENPNVGKTTAAHRLQKITMRERLQRWKHRGNDLLHPFLATRGDYNGGNDLCLSHSHALSIHSYMHTIQLMMFNNSNCFALSHIDRHMNFGLFTHMAPRGSLTDIYICVPFQSVGRITTGP